MNKKIILPISLIILVGLVVLVSAWATEYGAPIYKGWNLVYGFTTPNQLDGQSFDKSHIKAVYVLMPMTQEYVRFYPNPEEERMENIISKLGNDEFNPSITALWVYSDTTVEGSLNSIPHATEYWLERQPLPYNTNPLYKGWNSIGITSDIIGKSLNDIKGDCNIQKAYFWSFENQMWSDMINAGFSVFQNSQIGLGFVIKVSDSCKLGMSSEGNIPSIPNLPDDQKKCTDSDGGVNYNVKGTASKEGKGDTTDFCVDTTKLSEALCNNDGNPAYAQYNCPNGCNNGVCN